MSPQHMTFFPSAPAVELPENHYAGNLLKIWMCCHKPPHFNMSIDTALWWTPPWCRYFTLEQNNFKRIFMGQHYFWKKLIKMSELNLLSAENSAAMKVKGVQYRVINSGHTSPFNAYLQLSGHLTLLLLIYPPAIHGYKREDHPPCPVSKSLYIEANCYGKRKQKRDWKSKGC